MIKLILLIALVIILGIAIFYTVRNFHEYTLVHKNSMSFMESLNLTGMPIVSFSCNGKILNFLLDTGCNDSIINISVIKNIECEKLNKTTLTYGINGEDIKCEFYNIHLIYKDIEFVSPFISADLTEAFKKIKNDYGVQLHGFLGSKFFKKYKYVIDFNKFIAYSKAK